MIYCWEDNKESRFVRRKSNTPRELHCEVFPIKEPILTEMGAGGFFNKPRYHPCLWGGKSLCWDAHMHDNQINYLRKTSHLIMFFGAHREELYWLELRVSFLFLFSCKNNHNYECFGLELVSSQWPTVEIERSLSLGLKCQSRCCCETWGPHPPHTFHRGLPSGGTSVIRNSATLPRNVCSESLSLRT